jgi:methionyl-tRNA formyltransferase
MKIIFFGASRFVLPIIAMINTNFTLSLVITTERNETDAVPTYCKQHTIPYLSITHLSQAEQIIKKTQPTLGILAYFGLILPQQILTSFPKGILNIHPSLLPKYRGATPVQSTLLNNDYMTGVTIIKLDRQMDHGPILAQKTEPILPTDTTATLHEKLFIKGVSMLKNIIPKYLAENKPLQKQDDTQATYTKGSFTRQDGFIDNTNPPEPKQIANMIRAYYPWPGVWTRLSINGKKKIVKLLPENQIQIEGKQPMNLKDFRNGYPEIKTLLNKFFSDRSLT